ncbi:MAG TPA: hypothetical protein VN376_01965 [Longilinea sp.]|nr:hypothetical protein [Longilinea sp.]
MFTESDLRDLLGFVSPTPVLSIYLNTDPSEGNMEASKLRLRNMLKLVDLPEDEAIVERYFQHEYDWSGKGVVVFSSSAQQFFRAFSLAVPVRNWIYVGDRPSIKILADLFDVYAGYGVALVDKQGARFFHFHLGELREQEGILGEEIKHIKRGGASTVHGQRGGSAGQAGYEHEAIDRNMKDAAAFAAHFFEEKHIRRILIAGTDENVNLFRSQLPKSMQSLVMGTIPLAMTASHAEVLERALTIGKEVEKKKETILVDRLITLSAKGKEAVVGLEKTLEAVNESRVHTLVIVSEFRKAALRCPKCKTLVITQTSNCPVCDSAYEKVVDVIDLMVHQVMQKGGEVEVIQESEALSKAGSIGAILRY